MEPTPTIDRKRLERYPLSTHPLPIVFIVISVLGTVMWASIVASRVATAIIAAAPLDAAIPWNIELMAGSPWLALPIGLTGGMLFVYGIQKFRMNSFETRVNAFFLTREARHQAIRITIGRRYFILFLGSVIGFLLALSGICILLNANSYFAMFSAVVGNLLAGLPHIVATHREIFRRRRIALAWEGIDPPNNGLSLQQYTLVALLVVLMGSLIMACVYMASQLAELLESGIFPE